MSSDKTMQSSTKVLLSTFSCPFTWELTDIAIQSLVSEDRNYNSDEEDEDLPIVCIINLLVRCYESILCADTNGAKKKLDEADSCIQTIRQRHDLSYLIRVIEHIYLATKCYFFYETEDEKSIDQTLPNILQISSFNDKELIVLQGCKSIAYSMYYDFGNKKCIAAATEAVEGDEHNPLWHFILAKSLRQKRRLISIQSAPDTLERKHFEQAYNISKHPLFGIYYAQMMRECSRGQNINQQLFTLYKEILDLGTQNYKVLLKLALGFLKLRNTNYLKYAIKCLDIVDTLSPDNPCTFHYRAMFHEYRNEQKEAIKYYQQAANLMNFSAELAYIEYGWKIKHLDPINCLMEMLQKYKNSVPTKIQNLNLSIATSYYIVSNNVKDAAIFYLKGIEINPNCEKLHNFYKFLCFNTSQYKDGIYGFLHRTFLPKLKIICSGDTQLTNTYDQLKLACDTYFIQKASNVNK